MCCVEVCVDDSLPVDEDDTEDKVELRIVASVDDSAVASVEECCVDASVDDARTIDEVVGPDVGLLADSLVRD